MGNIPADEFVHLHIRSEYSFPDGACRLGTIITKIKELGQTAAAVTDRKTLYSAVLFYQAAKKAGIRPIIGCEFPELGILLCENETGYQNLIQIVSAQSVSLLKRYHAGLILLLFYPDNADISNMKSQIGQYRNLMGEENCFLAVKSHQIREGLRLSQETGIALIADSPVNYLTPRDALTQNILTCIRTGNTLDDLPEQNGTFLKSTQEIMNLFSEIPEAVLNTRKIADRCRLEFRFHELKLPHFYQPGIQDNYAYLKDLCQKGLYERYGQNPDASIRNRLDYELSVIQNMGFVDYFLIVWDFVRYAKQQEIPVGAGRGSAAGSLCAYCLDITEIDPIQENLLFERFLNPGRKSMPDIDVDFSMDDRSKVKDYVRRRYGADHVAEIITFDTLKAKNAVRDVGKVLQMPSQLIDSTARLLDSRLTLAECLKQLPELKTLCDQNPDVRNLLNISARIEKMPRHTSIHAAGVVITEEPVVHYVPVQKNDSTLVTQYTMTTLEELGLLKMDFLGLRNLTIIRDAEKSVQRNNPAFSIRKIPLDDEAVYQMLSEGRTSGVFQLESDGMRNFIMKMKPHNMEGILNALAIYRPGPMESIPVYLENLQHPEHIRYLHPILKPILENTYGCMLYQEQVMEICRKMAGYSYSQADNVRRAMSKKKHDVMLKERQVFLEGCLKNQIPESVASQVFDQMEQFASYAFNRSHAAAYARISYQTAYLKCHYFGEYMAALMTSVISETDKLSSYLEECRNAGIRLCPPDVNVSDWNFIFRDGVMQFGLLAIKGFGRGMIDRMLLERRKNGDFKSFSDFVKRMAPLGLYKNDKLLECIIQSGALDNLDYHRKQMLCYAERMLRYFNDESGAIEGQMSLFGETEHAGTLEIPDMPEFTPAEKSALEKQALGVYLSGHPLDFFQHLQTLLKCQEISDLQALPEKTHVRMICLVQDFRKHQTKTGDTMCFLTLEDTSGVLNAVMFPGVYHLSQNRLRKDAILYLTGEISFRDGKPSLVCQAARTEEELPAMLKNMQLCIKISSNEFSLAQKLIKICQKFPGETELIFYQTDTRVYTRLKSGLQLQISEASYLELKQIIPPEKMGCIPRITPKKQ